MWTRNYQNIISSNIGCKNIGLNGGSNNAFGDNYCLNFKDPNGSVREICSYNTSSNMGQYVSRGTFIYRNKGSDNTYYAYPSAITSQSQALSGAFSPGMLYVGFGSSATPATFEDYALESFVSNFSQKSASGSVTENADGTFTIDYQIIISATADITIQEIGLFLPTPYMPVSSGTTNYAYYALINRIVLDEPVSIASGAVGNITFSVTTPKITIR